MSETYRHTSVLLEETLDLLRVVPGGTYCDATLGGSGHARAILERSAPDGRLVGIDRDPAALAHGRQALASFGERVVLEQGNFADVVQILRHLGLSPVDGLLVDLGVSSHQLDTADRGFSFSAEGPLDMRMDPTQGPSAAELIATLSEAELARVIRNFGEEPASRRIARAIKRAQLGQALGSTRELARVVAGAVGGEKRGRIHPATRTFMALRMAVNDELGCLERFLETFTEAVRPGGRVAVIAFHSLEDRAVKRRFGALASTCVCPPGLPICACGRVPEVTLVARKAVQASESEVNENPRARSARLRVVERR
ncbi:MAG: 16S rRNA (cytosine(1402)-N(4))-methyltransferase RsmH [Deltaproteobacteria bacterium]|nr:16S rRNA (cytosine(1402)-N(4))-methyltransferase RsmH [Deltaproteobacteria bacterium]